MSKINIGDTVGDLVIQSIEDSTHRNKYYVCKCSCGKEIRLSGATLRVRTDCGCITPQRLKKAKTALIGKRSGKLLALRCIRTDNNRNVWLCKCDCGNLTEVTASNFNVKTQSCGRCCDTFNSKSKNYGYEEIPDYLLKNIQRGATDRGLDYTVSLEYIWNLFLSQNRKCKLTGRDLIFSNKSRINTASLDRINSKYGYIENNVQWIHKHVNIMKNKYDESYFIQSCEEIYFKNKHKIEPVQRPAWTDYFLGLAVVVAQRSIDAQTKVGAVLTDQQNNVISTGYNSFPRGMPDDSFPNVRDEKYSFVLHAEECCIVNASYSMIRSIDGGANLYVTMKPCLHCLKLILNANISNVYAIDTLVSANTEKDKDIWEVMLQNSRLNYYLIKPQLNFLKQLEI